MLEPTAFALAPRCESHTAPSIQFGTQFCPRPPHATFPPIRDTRCPKRRRTTPTAIIERLNKLSISADWCRPVATGSFGEVFFGLLEDTGEPVVLKRAYSTATARTLLRVERAINRKIDDGPDTHPAHWPKFLGDYFRNSQTFLVWRREGEGHTLEEYLSRRPPAALSAALQVPSVYASPLNIPLFKCVVAMLLLALNDLHERGIVHRDVKPANVLVAPRRGPRGRHNPLKLIDFGSSCDVRNLFWSQGINTLDPLYAAPEQRLSVLAPQKFDVFSVGMTAVGVLMPSFASESRLREFRLRLEAADFDLKQYREEFNRNMRGGSGGDVELATLFDRDSGQALEAFDLLCAMLKKSPVARKSVKACLRDLGL